MLTVFERRALEAVKGGGDVFDRGTAVMLRGLEAEGLVDICEPMGDYDGKGPMPFFGAITTAKGINAVKVDPQRLSVSAGE